MRRFCDRLLVSVTFHDLATVPRFPTSFLFRRRQHKVHMVTAPVCSIRAPSNILSDVRRDQLIIQLKLAMDIIFSIDNREVRSLFIMFWEVKSWF
ncbi:hypothetical protein KC19_7G036200 [Ceratodon purpureus]|uniref:Uncharacterized protein n=1 Tax=Ceratodon purpureus TaxID=3225 RepID=A0A8T0H6Z9_CERPU|nr:hypothetical protein KC19_7G036200 [Ceratodon purpureus]